MWDECIKHIMECIEKRNKDLSSFEKLHINEDDIDFILWSYHKFRETMEDKSKELPDKHKGFEIKCNNCGQRVELEQYFNQNEYDSIDIYELNYSGIGIVCNNCGNEILDLEYH